MSSNVRSQIDEHRFTEVADERRLLLLEEGGSRLIEEKELVRLMEAERKAFLLDQRRAHDAEVKELVAQSENQLPHREAKKGRLELAESTCGVSNRRSRSWRA